MRVSDIPVPALEGRHRDGGFACRLCQVGADLSERVRYRLIRDVEEADDMSVSAQCASEGWYFALDSRKITLRAPDKRTEPVRTAALHGRQLVERVCG